MELKRILEVNLTRSDRWHPGGINDWSLSDWAVALSGEVGEVCNVVKKMNRLRDGLAQKGVLTQAQYMEELRFELADVFLYLLLLSARSGIDLEAAVVEKFNKVSEEYGFPERLP